MSIDDIEQTGADDELFAGLHRSVAGATMTASAADVVALGRRTRIRHRAVAAGVGTSMAALVAAIGVLAPSAGTGGAQSLNIQDAGFSLQKGADGVVRLTVDEAFDPAKLKAALDRAGIKSDSQRVELPTDWDDNAKIPECAETPAAHTDWQAIDEATKDERPAPGSTPKVTALPPGAPSRVIFDFRPGQLPPGDVISLVQFDHHAGDGHFRGFKMLTILTGTPDKCVLTSRANGPGPAARK